MQTSLRINKENFLINNTMEEKTYAFQFIFIGKGTDEKKAHEDMIAHVMDDPTLWLLDYESANEV